MSLSSQALKSSNLSLAPAGPSLEACLSLKVCHGFYHYPRVSRAAYAPTISAGIPQAGVALLSHPSPPEAGFDTTLGPAVALPPKARQIVHTAAYHSVASVWGRESHVTGTESYGGSSLLSLARVLRLLDSV